VKTINIVFFSRNDDDEDNDYCSSNCDESEKSEKFNQEKLSDFIRDLGLLKKSAESCLLLN